MTGQCFVSCQLDPLSWSSPSLNPTSSSSTAPPPRSLVLVCSVRVSVYALQVPIRQHPSGEPRYGLCQRLYSLTTPLIQCDQNLQGSSCVKSPSSPEYSKASSSEETEDSETDDSDTSSGTTKRYAWSVSSSSSDEETEE